MPRIEIEIPVIRPGGTMFRSDSDWHNNAVINLRPSWYAYAEAYRRGADGLVAQAMDSSREIDYLALPIIFLYRQYLELSVKALILDAEELLEDSPASDPYGHRLDILWKRCKKALRALEDKPSDAEIEIIENCILQFDTIDASSESFRYPVRRDGSPVSIGTTYANLRVLKEEMHNVAIVIDSLLAGLSAMVDLQRDMYSDWGP